MATAVKGKKGFVKLKSTEKKSVRTSIFFTPKNFKAIMAKAKEQNITPQEYMRIKILVE
jgi:hypothetical protein